MSNEGEEGAMDGEKATGLAGFWRARAARSAALGDTSMRDYALGEAQRCEAAEAARAGQPGHAWLAGAWDRQCVRCGLRVRSLASGRDRYRRVELPSGEHVEVGANEDVDLPPCADGHVGEFATARAAAPWRHA